MNLLMISGDRSIPQEKKGPFYSMLEEFRQYWGRVDVICPKTKNQKPKTTFSNVHFHPSPHGLWYQPRWIVKQGKKLIKEHKHAVMAVHEYPPFYNGFGAEWLSRKTRVPYVIEIHHIVGHPRASSLTELVGRWLSHLFLVNDTYGAAAVRCVSRGTAGILERWGARKEALFIIPSFYLDHDVLLRCAQQTSWHGDTKDEKQYDVVSWGRLVANKGFEDVLRAMKLLPGVTLLLGGDGPKRHQLKRLAASLGVHDRVTFAGWSGEPQEVYRALQSAKVFVMNSRSEGGPRIALEAMALGLPVVSTKVGVMPDVLRDGENGIVTNGTPMDIAEKIETLLKYPATSEKLGCEARKVLQKFERRELIRRYADFLKSAAR